MLACVAWLVYLFVVLPFENARTWREKALDLELATARTPNTDHSNAGREAHKRHIDSMGKVAEQFRSYAKWSYFYKGLWPIWPTAIVVIAPMIALWITGWLVLITIEWLVRGFAPNHTSS